MFRSKGNTPKTTSDNHLVNSEHDLMLSPSEEKLNQQHGKFFKSKPSKKDHQLQVLEIALKEAKCDNELLLIRNMRYENEHKKQQQEIQGYRSCLANANLHLEQVNTEMSTTVASVKASDDPTDSTFQSSTPLARKHTSDSDDDTTRLLAKIRELENLVLEMQSVCHKPPCQGKPTPTKVNVSGDCVNREGEDRNRTDQEELVLPDLLLTESSIPASQLPSLTNLLLHAQEMAQDVYTLRTERKDLLAQLHDATGLLDLLSAQVETHKQEIRQLKDKKRKAYAILNAD